MGTGSPRSAPDVPREVLEDVLSVPRCRQILRILRQTDGPLPLADVAAAVRAHELDTAAAAVPSDERRAVREDIYSRHLPKLTATGLVEYDSMHGTLAPGPVTAGDRLA